MQTSRFFPLAPLGQTSLFSVLTKLFHDADVLPDLPIHEVQKIRADHVTVRLSVRSGKEHSLFGDTEASLVLPMIVLMTLQIRVFHICICRNTSSQQAQIADVDSSQTFPSGTRRVRETRPPILASRASERNVKIDANQAGPRSSIQESRAP